MSPKATFVLRYKRYVARFFQSLPWLPDTAYGVMTAGLGRVLIVHQDELQVWGWGFMEPIAVEVGICLILAGTVQTLAALFRRHTVRRSAAAVIFLVYASIGYNTPAPTGHWIYNCIAAILLGIIVRVY